MIRFVIGGGLLSLTLFRFICQSPLSVKACAALKTTCWEPADPLGSGTASGDSESPSMFCQEAYPCADGTVLAPERRSPLRRGEMVDVPLEMCLMPVKVSAGRLARRRVRDFDSQTHRRRNVQSRDANESQSERP